MAGASGGVQGRAREFFTGLYRRRGLFYFLYRTSYDHAYPLLCLHWLYWSARAALTGEPLVHFIGDSHTDPYRFEPRFITHHVGRGTAHNLGKPDSSSGSGKQLWAVLAGISKKRDLVGLVFGEIDCRVHFHYQFLKHGKKVPLEKLMDGTISNYGQAISRVKGSGYRVFAVGIPPAARQQNIYGYPVYGTPAERSRISRLFNARLGQYCASRGILYVDVYPQSSDAQGFLKKERAADEVHLNGRIVPFVRSCLSDAFGTAF